MGNVRTPPHSIEAETNLLGACLLSPLVFADVVERVVPEDFYQPSCATVMAALTDMHRAGHPIDPSLVAEHLRSKGELESVGGSSVLVTWQAGVPATSHAARYADVIVEHAARRRIITAAHEASESAWAAAVPPADVIDIAHAALDAVPVAVKGPPADLETLDAFRARPAGETAPWVVPGLLRRGWRAVMVGVEGSGKSLVAQQIAMCAAAGIHPLTFKPILPQVTLLVDLENDAHRIRSGTDMIEARLAGVRRAEGGCWLWSRPGGIDLRQRRDRSELEAALAHCRPQLVCLGPIYKAYASKASEQDDRVASEVQHVLDDLRTRFGFALLIEHHAGHGEGGNRKMRPFGSSLWLRWPEFGLALTADTKVKGSLEVGRWRGDRIARSETSWPDRLDKGGPSGWPWVGYWKSTQGASF